MASMQQCSEGHFFDSSKHTFCPWCGVGADPDRTAGGGQDKTRNVQGAPGPTPPPPQPNPPQGGGSGAATRRIVPTPDEPSGFDPVMGWLVCTEGPDRGRDYRLRTAKNFIGRAPEMDICIANDEAVSRSKHAAVTFEPEQKKFWLLPGDAQGLVYLNGDVVHTPTELDTDDVVKVGQTSLMFVPFCGERFQWR